MTSDATRAAHRQLETLFGSGSVAGLTDGQLLERFADRRRQDDSGQVAFKALVDRHGGMVLRACRRVLGDDHEAQEAAQATFLVLARRAGSVGRLDSVGGWLHGVATRVASKARVASTRRRARERRGGELAATRMLERQEARSADDPDRWSELHEELGLLPEKFRAPLVLCYLEGLTQEQAAETLRWPLGTVQSRLARGRARLKSRLTSRGVAPSAGLLEIGLTATPPMVAPIPWVEATVRLAIQFTTKGSEAIRAGAWPASAGLASEVLRAMGLNKLKYAAATLLVAATVAAGATRVARLDHRQDDPPGEQARVKAAPAPNPSPSPNPSPKPTPPQPQPQPQPQADRTITGVVLDDQGRPLAKAWVGSDIRPMQDNWENPRVGDIRERAEPFRDPKGEIIPPGAVGKYFEVRNAQGIWRPVSPDDIYPWEPHVFDSKGALPREEVARTYSNYNVRVGKGGWWMAGMPGVQDAVRTDARGRFTTRFSTRADRVKLHFASGDSALQATRTIKLDESARPIEVTLRPTRLVRVRVIEVPSDDPKASMNWTIYAVDEAGKFADEWQQWFMPDRNNHDPDHMKRHLEVRLPVGRWKAEFRSTTLFRVVDLEVPPGEGPVDLPDLELESSKTVQMVGNPAAEIEATDLDGRPVRLADFRGKVVVLDFWAAWCGPCVHAMPRLKEIQGRFRDQPLAILALHDASLAGAAEYRREIGPIRERLWKGEDLPFRVLLDRAPAGQGTRPFSQGPGEKGSGRSADAYEISSWPSTFVIDRDGKLVGKFELDALESTLEDQFGLPHAKPPVAKGIARAVFPGPRRNVKVHGRVVGPDGRGVSGASLEPEQAIVRQKDLKTDAQGDFAFEAEEITIDHFFLRVAAEGLASKIFRLDDTGDVREPLRLGIGAVVTGRVLRDGRPVVGLEMGVNQVNRHNDSFLGWPRTKTDDQGRFRFDHAFTDQEFIAFAEGQLKDQVVVIPRAFKTAGDGSSVDLGNFEVKPGRKLAGRVVFSDGKAIPAGTRVLASAENAGGSFAVPVDPATGRFEGGGLPPYEITVVVQFPDNRQWLPPGYRLSPTMKCVSPLSAYMMKGRLDRDVTDMVILFEPGEAPRMTLDPGRLADFEEARAGLIEGAPPG